MTRTYYDLLGVESDVDTERVRAAYRERVKEVHPDVSDRPDAAEQFRALSAAKETLCDPVERARYDRMGHAAYVGDSPPDADTDSASADPHRAGADVSGASTASTRERRRGRRGKRPRAGRAARERADAWASGRDHAWWQARETEEAWDGATTTSSASSGQSYYRANPSDASGYRVSTRAESAVEFTVERALVAVAVFFCYPMLLGVAVLPPFTLAVRAAAAICALLLVAHTLSVPESGVLVFGALTLVAPVGLLLGGVGLLSVAGVLAWAFCWVPFVIAGANLLALRG